MISWTDLKSKSKDKSVGPMNLRCKRCGYSWIPRLPELPKCCPSCKSYKWQERK